MPRRSVRHPLLRLEQLDERSLPSISFNHGTLTIFGTGGNDLVEVMRSGSQIIVGNQSFDASQVRMIVVDAGDGDDTVTIDSQITATTWLFGRLGNDRIVGGGGLNHIYGGHGNDVLIGGPGRDSLVGGSGENLIQAQPDDEIRQGQPDGNLSPSSLDQQILDLVNERRSQAGLAPLQWSTSLAVGADVHSRNMASMAAVVGPSAAMSHLLLGVNAPTLGSRADIAGYDYRALGENVAYGYASAAAVVDAWMNSPGHRANILSTSYTQIGIAVAYSAHGLPYYTQFFGSPATAIPATPPSMPGGSAEDPANSNPASNTIAPASSPPIPAANTSAPMPTPAPISFRRTAAMLRAHSLGLSLTSTRAPATGASTPTISVTSTQSTSGSRSEGFSTTVAPARPLPVIAVESPNSLSTRRPNQFAPTPQTAPTSTLHSDTSSGPAGQVVMATYRFTVRSLRWSLY